jgi:uncharacterized membrane protein YkvA (DUF1232 family)
MAAAAKIVREANKPGSPPMGKRIGAIPRMIRASASGEYRGLSRLKLALMAAGVAYIVSPVDLVPELFFFVFGLVDDVAVAATVIAALIAETDDFLEWEYRTGRSTTHARA